MNPLVEFLDTIVKIAEEQCDLDSPISLMELSKENSLYAEIGEGFVDTQYYSKQTVKTVPVLFLCRNTDQAHCIEQLNAICDYFQGLKKYPSGKTFFWIDSEIVKTPSKIGRDEDGTWHYSCILNNRIYY